MKTLKIYLRSKGCVLVISMIFMVLLSVISIGMATMSDNNLQIANNYSKGSRAIESAQSGLEILRHYLDDKPIQPTLQGVASELPSSMSPYINLGHKTVSMLSITLSSPSKQSYDALITQSIDDTTLQADITGKCGDISRTIRTNFDFEETGNSVFDFGVATKGPLDMTGQAEIDGVNTVDIAIEAGVYIEGVDGLDGDSFSITNNASVAGNVSIADPDGTYDVGDNAYVGGVQGDENVIVGVDYVEFPTPNPDYFSIYATGDVIDSATNLNDYPVLNNVTIDANTNPTFASNVTINGVLFIETPNQVSFAGQTIINGVIVGDGSLDNPDSSLTFSGQVISNDASGLDEEQFGEIVNETGTFILAPGFSLDFSGQASTINGAIAGSGISFTGQAGGTINGSIINYSTDVMTLTGQTSLTFNRSGSDSNPSGFDPIKILRFDPSSYSEI
ncbi:MAG: hypothetical protein KAS96_04245 [Planctomycetes bacterium]|nr:hypothetical protein [Planctomycetota bacterium]